MKNLSAKDDPSQNARDDSLESRASSSRSEPTRRSVARPRPWRPTSPSFPRLARGSRYIVAPVLTALHRATRRPSRGVALRGALGGFSLVGLETIIQPIRLGHTTEISRAGGRDGPRHPSRPSRACARPGGRGDRSEVGSQPVASGDLQRIFRALGDAGVRYLVVGGVAVV